jgi:hypothetical protein
MLVAGVRDSYDDRSTFAARASTDPHLMTTKSLPVTSNPGVNTPGSPETSKGNYAFINL